MLYDIQSKSDFQVGATLIVRIPEEDLDQKAMYTIQADTPGFILPFHSRIVDGQVEFTYQVGNRCKLSYVAGDRSPSEYADFWCSLLQPLLDCEDWFMNAYSFVLNAEYLYYDREKKQVNLVYIPSRRCCSNEVEFQQLVTDVAKQNHVTDMNLESKVAWALHDFNIQEFLQLIKGFQANRATAPQAAPQAPVPPQAPIPPQAPVPPQPAPRAPMPPQAAPRAPMPPQPAPQAPVPPAAPRPQAPMGNDDIMIQFAPDNKKEKKAKNGGLFGAKKEKTPPPPKAPKAPKPTKQRKGAPTQEIIQGAAAQPIPRQNMPYQGTPAYIPQPADEGMTVVDLNMAGSGCPRFRYVGPGGHPGMIEVSTPENTVFTIGRFDVSVGRKQSNFEFDKQTKEVSRRHAAVEHKGNAYFIVDLGSSAGTFLNGRKLPPNAPFQLENGNRVSFGSAGADYVWEG